MEYHDVPPKCEFCKVFAHPVKLCRERPLTAEEKHNHEKDATKMRHNGMTPNAVRGVDEGDDGFTVVTRRKGGTKPSGSGTGQIKRERHQVIQNKNVPVHQRNIVKRKGPEIKAPQDNGAGSGVHNTQENTNETQGKEHLGQNSGEGIEVVHLGDMEVDPSNSVKANHTKSRFSLTSVVEIANRFILLDEEGKELDEGDNVNVQGNKGDDMDRDMNAGWIKKQERILNTKYNELVNQSQRFEAKKHVQERLVPLSNVLSSWSTRQKEYFRLLCNLHNFGEGYRAAAWDQPTSADLEHANLMEYVESTKEVEPEKECTTDFMILDKGQHTINLNMEGQSMEYMQSSRESGLTKEALNN
ncbi:hypothetical protein L1987_67256 [Smallanthus sonchifolius]|uniref:Uncharacterized protein n=1 Tax=Smallanthus sonchifolius TaxID=185202 RepID=A0ACB9B484_9ASTR|nr:hypothetical protein L1987_67256 [Smallanthus sonchifolius]